MANKHLMIPILSDDEQEKDSIPQDVKDIIDVAGNRIYYYGSITQDKSVRLIKLLQEKSEEMQFIQIKLSLEEIPPIYLHINSYGGEVHASFGIADNILSCKTPVYTLIEGVAMSGATIMSIVGKKRFIRKHAHMLIHQLSGEHDGNWENLKDDYKNSELIMDQIYDLYEKYSNIKRTKIKNMLKHDLYFTAEQCLEHGLIDEIIG